MNLPLMKPKNLVPFEDPKQYSIRKLRQNSSKESIKWMVLNLRTALGDQNSSKQPKQGGP